MVLSRISSIPKTMIACGASCSTMSILFVFLTSFYLSTEEHPLDKEGLVPQNFAYLVEGSRFYRSQSDMLPTTLPKARHYRFVTGWTCLDVISMLEPKFEISAKSSRSVDTA